MSRWGWIILSLVLAASPARASPATTQSSPDFKGLWLSNLGLMDLQPSGNKVKGRYALAGISRITGEITGRKLEFTYRSFSAGKGSFELSEDGKTFRGQATNTGASKSFDWHGRRATEFVRHAKLRAGQLVDGSTRTTLLTYTVRAPEGYRASDEKKWPTILILHGSNMNSDAYVNTLASAWPDIAKEFLILGINGETASNTGENPAFNYTYVDYVGRSTFKGYPGTDRESPALVTEALDELSKVYPIGKIFVGGHSQGGFLTYSLLMNLPEKFAGAFPISAGVIFQCEPSAYEDEKVRAEQRKVPLAIVHGKQDPNVSFDNGEYAATIFGEANWPALRFFADSSGAGHRFALLPVDKAIRWLAAQSSDDPKELLDFAEKQLAAKNYRDAIAALNRAGAMKPDDKDRLDRLSKQVDDLAKPRADSLLASVRKDPPPKWIDGFLAFRDDFEFATASKELMQAFNELRAQHEEPARKLMGESRAAFNQGNRKEGYSKYQQIVDNYPAASSYRSAKRWLAQRK